MKKNNEINGKENHRTHWQAFLVWPLVFSVLFGLLVTIDVTLTSNTFLYNTINSVMGGEQVGVQRGDPSKYQYYQGKYKKKADVLSAAIDFNEKICEEGTILLKNDAQALPLAAKSRITVLGKNSVNLVLGGSGSNAGSNAGKKVDLNDSLEKAGFVINPTAQKYYASSDSGNTRPDAPGMGSILTGFPIGESVLPYPSTVTSSFADYHDAAVVVFSRIGGEGYDLPRTMFYNGSNYTSWNGTEKIPGAKSKDSHYLQLDQNETDLLQAANDSFDKVIVVFNSASAMELGFLKDSSLPNVKAALWMGHPGTSGAEALGKILAGTINPSGKTVDAFAKDFREDPSWENFGNGRKEDGNRYTYQGKARNAYFVEYREGIYVGYRYDETKADEEKKKDPSSTWYSDHVVYPFGYGLSYTTFDWSVREKDNPSFLGGDTTLTYEVTVKNTGNVVGKDVVELYSSAPYLEGGIEKPAVALGNFLKTDLLAPQESRTYTLSLPLRTIASYDDTDKNKNGFKGYELDPGTYRISLCTDSHTPVASFDYPLSENIQYPTSENGTAIHNLFDDVTAHIEEYLSRKGDFANADSLKGASEASYRETSQDIITALTYHLGDKDDDPWSQEYAEAKKEETKTEAATKLYELIRKDYDDPKWEGLLSHLSADEKIALISSGNYRTVALDSVDKPLTIDADGPMGFAIFMGDDSVYDTCYYASECVLAATYNTDLAQQMGAMIGEEGLVGDQKGDGKLYSGWYAPAMNLHRSPFGGRNFEYYSEDPFLSAKMAENVVEGAQTKGVYTYCKHFALNEQETNRDTTGLVVWANEQSMRELYFQPFEAVVERAHTQAMMSSFTRLGTCWAGGDYALLTSLLRKEWGFKGMVITDFNLKTYMDTDQMLRAGGDLSLSPCKGPTSTTSDIDRYVIDKAVKNILYTVANSNAMNGRGEGVVWGYSKPWWLIWLIAATCAIAVIDTGLWTCFVLKKKKDQKGESK